MKSRRRAFECQHGLQERAEADASFLWPTGNAFISVAGVQVCQWQMRNRNSWVVIVIRLWAGRSCDRGFIADRVTQLPLMSRSRMRGVLSPFLLTSSCRSQAQLRCACGLWAEIRTKLLHNCASCRNLNSKAQTINFYVNLKRKSFPLRDKNRR